MKSILKYYTSQNIKILKKILILSFFIFFSCSSNELWHQLNLQEMEAQFEKGDFPKTTSVLISRKGKIVYEKYFGDGLDGHQEIYESVFRR